MYLFLFSVFVLVPHKLSKFTQNSHAQRILFTCTSHANQILFTCTKLIYLSTNDKMCTYRDTQRNLVTCTSHLKWHLTMSTHLLLFFCPSFSFSSLQNTNIISMLSFQFQDTRRRNANVICPVQFLDTYLHTITKCTTIFHYHYWISFVFIYGTAICTVYVYQPDKDMIYFVNGLKPIDSTTLLT